MHGRSADEALGGVVAPEASQAYDAARSTISTDNDSDVKFGTSLGGRRRLAGVGSGVLKLSESR